MPTLELSLARSHDMQMEGELPRFHAFDGSSRIVIEAHDYQDAISLCVEMGWELICACDG
jgi:hypothetical protein